ncbi:zinc-binding dehydrogenase [Nocardia sp. NPDC050697]|uniref:zinc-binding dehydrogenase n=1 Tax=Nocardia sp. NPDC050697 TaxID=3155158 RepID=UPI0033EFBBAF
MRAIEIRAFGGPEGLAVTELPAPEPGPGEVGIAVEAIGVGGVDAVIRRGTLGGYGFRAGHIPGSEVAGVVTGVGAGVDDAWLGRRVWGFTGTGGGYVEQAVAAEVLPLPEGLTARAAVALGGSGVVAHFGLAHARFAAGESVLVRGAAGSIGLLTVQLAAAAGASEIAVTTSSPERGQRLRALGATRVLDRAGTGGADFDVIIDVVAGPALPEFLDKLAPNGRLVAVGVVAGYPPADFGTTLLRGFQRSLSFATFSAGTVDPAARRAVRAGQFAAAARGELAAVVHEVLPLEQAALAHHRMDAGEVFGRVVLTP